MNWLLVGLRYIARNRANAKRHQRIRRPTPSSVVVVENIQILSRIMERRCHQIKRRKAAFVLLLCSICIRIDASDAVKIKKGSSFLLVVYPEWLIQNIF